MRTKTATKKLRNGKCKASQCEECDKCEEFDKCEMRSFAMRNDVMRFFKILRNAKLRNAKRRNARNRNAIIQISHFRNAIRIALRYRIAF